jgi:signal transduction histidine kinase
VEVRDDGGGFGPDTTTTGFGLRGMRERVDLLEGRLEIVSGVGRGTKVAVALPLDPGGT